MTKKILIIFAVISAPVLFPGWMIFPLDSANITEPQNNSGKGLEFLSVEEDLTYEVSWSFIKLGTIRAKMLSRQDSGKDMRYFAVCYINSYAGVIASLHTIYETIMDNECYSDSFMSREKDGDNWNIVRYRFDRESNRLIAEESIAENEEGDGSRIQKIDTLSVNKKCLDGLSILYFARANVKSGNTLDVPIIIQGKQGSAMFNFYGKRTSAEIDAVKYPIDVVEFEGEAKFSGVFGLSGPFKGWFSNDSAQIPITAKIKVILGSVNIELKQWQRTGWNPPKYTEK